MCGGKTDWNVFQSWHYCYCILLLIVPSSWKGIKEPISVWIHAEKHQRRKKSSHAPVAWFSLCRAQTWNCAIIVYILYIPQIGAGLKTSGLVILCLARMKLNINSNNQDLLIGKKCWDFVVYTLGEVITFSYIVSYTTQILLKVNGSSIHEDFWCVFQEFVINQGINRLFLVVQVGWLTRKQRFPWKKT